MAVAIATELDTEMSNYLTAIRAQNYETALRHLETAQGLIALIPDSEREAEKLTWRPEGIAQAIASVRQQINKGRGVVNMLMTPTRDDELG